MNIQATDIETLLEGCIRQQPAAQKELVRRYAPALLSVARRYARPPVAAEDVLQEGLLLIFKNIGLYNAQKGAFSTWAGRVVANAALGMLRRRHIHYETAMEILPETFDVGPDIFARLGFEQILRLLDDLPDGAREVFNMAVFEEYSHEEIAAALGIAAGTSRSLLSRGRKILQEKILILQHDEVARI
jgi:RNA polymerase sigma factor (sigma-70 family)